MNNIHKTFVSSGIYNKQTTVTERYHERFCLYKQTGPDFVIDYELTLIPTEKQSVSIFFVPSDSTSIVIEPISDGIEEYILTQNNIGVEVSGFDVVIENAVLHPVDYKPNRTQTYTYQRIVDILFKNGVKRYNSGGIAILKDPGIVYEELSPLKNIANLTSSPFSKSFDLSYIHNTKIEFPSRFCIKEFVSGDSFREFRIKVKVYSTGWSDRRVNQALVLSNEKSECINAMFLVNEVLDIFIRDIYSQGYNLGSVIIWILESDLDYLERRSVIFQDEFIWFLKYLLLSNNNIQSI